MCVGGLPMSKYPASAHLETVAPSEVVVLVLQRIKHTRVAKASEERVLPEACSARPGQLLNLEAHE
jgi:hypothetical protein